MHFRSFNQILWQLGIGIFLLTGFLSGCVLDGNPPATQATINPVPATQRPPVYPTLPPETSLILTQVSAPTLTATPPTPTVDLGPKMQEMKILLYEDMIYDRYVKAALDEAGFTYTDTKDGMGRLKEQLLSDTAWDLVIIASEGRYDLQGEFFDYMKEQIDRGASVIFETWIIDWAKEGRIQTILDDCGLRYEANWVSPDNREVYWTDEEHPIANEPNQVSLIQFVRYWSGDVGDLVAKEPDSQAVIVGSANAPNPDQDGLITLCYDGRLILQTFASHDHPRTEAIWLWQNYIYFALKNRILSQEKVATAENPYP